MVAGRGVRLHRSAVPSMLGADAVSCPPDRPTSAREGLGLAIGTPVWITAATRHMAVDG